MKLIVLIALIGCALAIPNPFPEEKFGPMKGIKIPDSQNGIRIPVLPSPVEKFGPIKGIKIPDLPSPVEKYGPTNGLRIPDQYYQKGYSKGYYHPVRCVPARRRSRCIRRRRPRCYALQKKNTDQLTDLESQT